MVLLQYIARAVSDQTNLHPLGAAALALIVIATLSVKRAHALIPFLVILTLISAGQRIVIVGLDFTFLRIATLVLWARVLFRREHVGLKFTAIDYTVFALGGWALMANVLLHLDPNKVLMQIAKTIESVGGYIAFRALVRSPEDLKALSRSFAVLAIISAGFFLFEVSTQRNAFAIFGGVNEFTAVREGRLRCQGPYAHPLMAGCFWASTAPIIAVPLFYRGNSRMLHTLGLAACVIVVGTTASSTPVAALGAGVLGAALYPVRVVVPVLRYSSFFIIAVLHAVMKAPVWHLIGRMKLVGGSTGFHRFYLIDNFLKNWDEWILWGQVSTEHWGHMMWDLTNQFVLMGVRGGIIQLTLFVILLVLCFQAVGKIMRQSKSKPMKLWGWAAGVCLWVHCVGFFGVSYFGSNTPQLYLCFAIFSALLSMHQTQRKRMKAKRRRRQAPFLAIQPTGA